MRFMLNVLFCKKTECMVAEQEKKKKKGKRECMVVEQEKKEKDNVWGSSSMAVIVGQSPHI